LKKVIQIAEKLKDKWGINTYLDVFLICIVFAFAGSSVLIVADFIYNTLGFNDETHWSLSVLVRVILVFPCYQLLLLIYALFLGQFKFFWEKEKKLGKWFLSLFPVNK